MQEATRCSPKSLAIESVQKTGSEPPLKRCKRKLQKEQSTDEHFVTKSESGEKTDDSDSDDCSDMDISSAVSDSETHDSRKRVLPRKAKLTAAEIRAKRKARRKFKKKRWKLKKKEMERQLAGSTQMPPSSDSSTHSTEFSAMAPQSTADAALDENVTDVENSGGTIVNVNGTISTDISAYDRDPTTDTHSVTHYHPYAVDPFAVRRDQHVASGMQSIAAHSYYHGASGMHSFVHNGYNGVSDLNPTATHNIYNYGASGRQPFDANHYIAVTGIHSFATRSGLVVGGTHPQFAQPTATPTVSYGIPENIPSKRRGAGRGHKRRKRFGRKKT